LRDQVSFFVVLPGPCGGREEKWFASAELSFGLLNDCLYLFRKLNSYENH